MITVRDEHLEEQIDTERKRRGDATMAKTLADLVREYLTLLAERARTATPDDLPVRPAGEGKTGGNPRVSSASV